MLSCNEKLIEILLSYQPNLTKEILCQEALGIGLQLLLYATENPTYIHTGEKTFEIPNLKDKE